VVVIIVRPFLMVSTVATIPGSYHYATNPSGQHCVQLNLAVNILLPMLQPLIVVSIVQPFLVVGIVQPFLEESILQPFLEVIIVQPFMKGSIVRPFIVVNTFVTVHGGQHCATIPGD
jgi:ABC-type maltose transport system permease subunit